MINIEEKKTVESRFPVLVEDTKIETSKMISKDKDA